MPYRPNNLKPLWLLLVFFFPLLIFSQPRQSDKVEVTILLNEGILLQSGQVSILIDAFTEMQDVENVPPEKLVQLSNDILEGRPPFSKIQLALVSHPHREHFIAANAIRFLEKHPETRLISTLPVIEAIRKEPGFRRNLSKQLQAIKETDSQAITFSRPRFAVKFLIFKHEASMFYPEEVLGFIIDLNGQKILHVGDAEMRLENWQKYDIASQKIKLALVPFWLFKEEVTRNIIREYIAPEKIAVVQVLSEETQHKIPALTRKFPQTVFLSEALKSAEF